MTVAFDEIVLQVLKAVDQARKDGVVEELLAEVTKDAERIVGGSTLAGLPMNVQRLYASVVAEVARTVDAQLQREGKRLEDRAEIMIGVVMAASVAMRVAHRALA